MDSVNLGLAAPPDQPGAVALRTLQLVEYQEYGEHLATMMLCGG